MLGKEENAEWYDGFFLKSLVHRMMPKEFDFFQVWKAGAQWVNDLDAKNVVDLGCGIGHFASVLCALGWRGNFIGEDFSTVAIEHARSRGCALGEFRVCDIRRSSRITADAVTAFEVLEHVEDDFAVLARIAPSTPVCFSVPNMDLPGHVRYFKSSEEVARRYAGVVSIDTITQFEFVPSEVFWLAKGRKADGNRP